MFRNSAEQTSIPPSPHPSATTPVRVPSTRSTSPPLRKRKKKCSDPVEELLISELGRTAARDEACSFGDHVAARLRGFSAQQRARACLEIDRVLYDIEFPNEPIISQLPSYPQYPPHPHHHPYSNQGYDAQN